ncbi:MAG: putative membrane protein [Nitrospinales bacterium]|jgi:uncharacterized membrane protein
MFDLPLHPVVVHFPIVLGILLPLVALACWWAIRKYQMNPYAWVLVIALAFGYGVSSYIAVEMGEEDEEKVEEVVSEKIIEEHEEAGELILWVSGGLFIFSLAGLYRKGLHAVRLGVVILALVAVIPLVDAGHTGGKLVYQYGAANAHLPAKQQAMLETGHFIFEDDDGDKDKDKDAD